MNNTDPVRAAIQKVRADADRLDAAGTSISRAEAAAIRVVANDMEAALASAPPIGGMLGYVRRAAIETLRTDDEVMWVRVHAEPPTDSVPVYLPSALAEEYTRGRCDGWEAAKAAAPSAPVGAGEWNPKLPPLIGTLAGLKDYVKPAVEAYGRACARAGRDAALAQQPAAPSGEAVAEVMEFCGLRIPAWIGTGDAPDLPIGTKLYAAPQQPAAVDEDDDAEPVERCESMLSDCGPAVAWDCEGLGACARCAMELGWIAAQQQGGRADG